MIDIQEVWVPQMLWCCGLVRDDERLALAFSQKPDEVWTSVTSYDELIEQIFDDLDAVGMLPDLARSDVESHLKIALQSFVSRLSDFDQQKGEAAFETNSPAWASVRAAAADAIRAAAKSKATDA